jgi:hypothetical protein
VGLGDTAAIRHTVEIAGLRFRFACAGEAARLVEQRYEAFLVGAGGPEPTCEIAVRIEARAAAPASWERGEVQVEERAGVVRMRGPGMRARVEADGRRATIASSDLGPIEVLLRYLLAARLLERGGLLVHASAVERAGGAWVFCGPSGAGKSTIAAHLEGRVLCDEAIALLVEGGRVRVHATPYWRAVPSAAPAAGLVFPRRGAAVTWEKLSPARATARLLSQCGPFAEGGRARALPVAARLTKALPCAAVTLTTIDDIANYLSPRLSDRVVL